MSLVQKLLPSRSISPKYKPVSAEDDPSSLNTAIPSSSSSPTPQDANSSPDPFFNRGITFTRGFTVLDAAASFRRTVTHTLGYHVDEDADERWTQQLLESYNKAHAKGTEGNIPLQAEFARNIEFWKTMIIVGVIASLLGLVSLFFLNIADYVS